jgi:peptidoglycan/xylan/chitin deacetylase (PgdA/CDA1 family)
MGEIGQDRIKEKLNWNIQKTYLKKAYEHNMTFTSLIRSSLLKLYYFVKPALPRFYQLKARKLLAKIIREKNCRDWPINSNANTPPENWSGWPGKKQFAVVLRHDIESIYGMENIDTLIEIEKGLGFRSSFNFSPERYDVSETLITEIKKKGCEVGLHGLKHDGKLYSSRKEFQKRAVRINKYLRDWDVRGFVSPSSHHNYEWISELNILYDSSSFDTDPFEPQPDAANTIFPFIYTSSETGKKYVELPYTLPQDSTLFVILGEQDIRIWKEKIDWIAENNGMVLLNTHPDYMSFDNNNSTRLYPFNFYKEILEYITTKYHDQFIHFLPYEVAEYWMKR